MVYQPITTECQHNVCRVRGWFTITALKRTSFRSVNNNLYFENTGMPPAVLQSRGLHLPGLQARPGQKLLHGCQQIPARHSKSVFPRVQQRAMIIGSAYSALGETQCKVQGEYSVEAIKNQFLLIYFYDHRTAIFVSYHFSPRICHDV